MFLSFTSFVQINIDDPISSRVVQITWSTSANILLSLESRLFGFQKFTLKTKFSSHALLPRSFWEHFWPFIGRIERAILMELGYEWLSRQRYEQNGGICFSLLKLFTTLKLLKYIIARTIGEVKRDEMKWKWNKRSKKSKAVLTNMIWISCGWNLLFLFSSKWEKPAI